MVITGSRDRHGNYVPSELGERLHKLSLEAAGRCGERGTTLVVDANYDVQLELYLAGAKSALEWAYDVSLIHADHSEEVVGSFLESLGADPEEVEKLLRDLE